MAVDTLFVGVGSDHGDDRVGWLVAEDLKSRFRGGVLIRQAKAPLDLLDWMDGVRCLAICDACRGIGPVGTWMRCEWPVVEAPFVRAASSHALGLIDTLRLACQLGYLPQEVLLWGVEIASDQPGDPLTVEVAAAISAIVGDVASFLQLRPMVTC